jgi:hypothetical protein
MSARYRKGRRIAWREGLETCLGEDTEAGGEVLLGFLADRSRDAFMRFKNRMRRYQQADGEELVPVTDYGELAGGVLYYALDGAADLPLDFLLEAGFGDEEERRQWAASLTRAAGALAAAKLAVPLLEPHHAFVTPEGRLRLTPPEDLGTEGGPEDAASPLSASLLATPGRTLTSAWSEARAEFEARPEPRVERSRPRHKRPAPDLDDPGRTTGPGPYRIPTWAKAAVIAAIGASVATLAQWIGGGG